ncbi:sugar ABC transporter permease [Haloechinothrix sp. LS1_15]|nr:sugar ABC transporter permease [Haloechinothrix sp. LS1_15]
MKPSTEPRGGASTPSPGSRDSTAKRARRYRLTSRLTPYLLLGPTLVIIAGLLLYPLYRMAVMSTQDVGLREVRGEPAESVGLDNFSEILTSDTFWQALRNTFAFAAVAVALTLVLGTLVGLLIHRLGRVMSTTVIISAMLAWAMPHMSVATVWRWLFDENGGVANWVLNRMPDWLTGTLLGRTDWSGYTWFLDPLPLYFVLTLAVVWQSFPFIAVSVLAGLKSIPAELFEAARVDGAGAWRSFWNVTFPLLKPVFAVLLVLSIIWDFKVFTQLHVLAGGIGNPDVFNLSLYAYAEAFRSPPRMGLGSAIAIVLTAILMVITVAYVRQIVRQEDLR